MSSSPRFVLRPLEIILAITVPLLVYAWHRTSRPSHLEAVVAELGSTMRFVRAPCPNNAESKMLFIETTERGYGVYLSGMPGKRKLLYQQVEKGPGTARTSDRLLGWSQDDKLFAYFRIREAAEVVICEGETGRDVVVMPVAREVIRAAWLPGQVLAFLDKEPALYTMRREGDKWLRPQYCKVSRHFKGVNSQFAGFTSMGSQSVAWEQAGALWRCDAASSAPERLWGPASERLLEFAWSEEARKFLLHCRDTNGHYLAHFSPWKHTNQFSVLTRINTDGCAPSGVSFVNNGAGYAYLREVQGRPDTLVVKPADSQPETQFQWQNQVRSMAAGRHALYVTSSLQDEPTGIWRYDPSTAAAECAVPNAGRERFHYVKNGHLIQDAITNSVGERLGYYLLSPVHVNLKKKQPLVVGILGNQEMGFNWSANHQAIANNGAYFLCVDGRDRTPEQRAEDALAVCDSLVKGAQIDPTRLYLYGDSMGVPSVYRLMEEHPARWRATILFSPTFFPAPSRIPGAKLFIDTGGADPSFGKQGVRVPMGFQDEAAKAGIPATLFIHPGLGHIYRLPPLERERMRGALTFLHAH